MYISSFSLASRYIDDIFMTTNQIDDMKIVLDKAQRKDPNIEIEPTISTSVNYLDVIITNENGQLRTSIYHKPTAEPYILPYTSDHPRHVYRNIPYAALLRVARICSHVDDFSTERIRIDMSLLLNRYPPNFIQKQFHRFFRINNAVPILERLDEEVYHRVHRQLLYQPTRREKQLAQLMKDPIKSPEVLQPRIWNSKVMYPRYTFDTGLTQPFHEKFYEWWNKYYVYTDSPVKSVKIRLTPQTNRTLEHYFIHKKPSTEMLTFMEQPI